MDGSVFIECIYFSLAEKCTLSHRQCEAQWLIEFDSLETAAIMDATSSLSLEDTSALIFFRKGNTLLWKN